MFGQMESLAEFYETIGNCSAGFAENCSLLEQAQPTNDTYPDNLRFNDYLLTLALVYTALFLVAAIGNLTVFISLFRSRRRKSRISLMIRHLAIADLLVTFINIPLEVGWRVTVQWVAGNLACKTFQFLRAFSLYLSSNVLVCVSLDRYFAVLHPLRVNDARRRGKMMLACAWSMSLICAIPQSIVFHVSTHPLYPSFLQCVTFGFFSSGRQEIAYNLLCVSAMYFVPLVVIIVAYTAIMCEITHKSRDTGGETYQTSSGRMRLRRSDISNIERAKSRTLKMTVTIVLVFVWCWTPYVVMTLWYMFDRASAEKLPNWLQDALFMMAVSNSCMNPLVYGSFAINFRRECSNCLGCFGCSTSQPPLTRKSTDEATQAAGQGSGLARRLIKCVMTLRKVGSGATRSTIMVPAVNNIPPAPRAVSAAHPPKNSARLAQRPPSVGHITFLSEPPANRGFRSSFHSEPSPRPEERKAETSQSDAAKII